MPITKKMLISAAEESKRSESNIWIVNDGDLKIIIDSIDSSSGFLQKHHLDFEENLIQGFQPDQILKYNMAHYEGHTISLDTFLSIIAPLTS